MCHHATGLHAGQEDSPELQLQPQPNSVRFETGLCIEGWPWTFHGAPCLPASPFPMLGLQVCITTYSHNYCSNFLTIGYSAKIKVNGYFFPKTQRKTNHDKTYNVIRTFFTIKFNIRNVLLKEERQHNIKSQELSCFFLFCFTKNNASIKDVKDAGVVFSTPPFNSPILLVQKTCGSQRMTTDYQ